MRRRLALLGLVLVAAGVGIGAEAWQRHRAAAASASAGAASRVPVVDASPARDAPAARPGATASAAGPARSAAATARAPALPEAAVEGLEVCGGGRVTAAELRRWQADPAAGEAWAEAFEARLRPRVDAAVAGIAARLAAGNPAQQVAARLLMGDAEGAALLAAPAGEPLAYQPALNGCQAATSPACARLDVQRWAALDPGDARPWLRQLGEAHRRGDEAAVDASLAAAAARPRLSRGSHLLQAQAVPFAALEPDAAVRARAVAQIIGIDAATLNADLFGLLKVCREAAPQRLPHCRSVAQQTLAAAGDLMEARTAHRLAELTGVPPEERAYDGATLKAAQEALFTSVMAHLGVDCASMAAIHTGAEQRGRQGELAMALALLPPARKH